MAEYVETSSRKTVFFAGILLIFLIFLGRLIQLQFLYSDLYGKRSEENSIRQIPHDPIRGLIFDRNGQLIVDNRPSYTITLIPAEFNRERIPLLSNILNVDTSLIKEKIVKGIQYNRFVPVKIKRDIDFQTLAILQENIEKLHGVDYQVESKRFYPTGARASHLLGYTKEISDQQLLEMRNEYAPGDNIGATGLEAAYERYLRGEKGYELITVNAVGQMLGKYQGGEKDIAVREGDDLYLSLDAGLQAFAESLMADRRGAVVALDPSDGSVLTLVSKPDYDLSNFSSVTPPEIWRALNNDENKPLFNRATLTRYPPGSTFKMVLAAAALEEGIIGTQWRVQCTGALRFGTRTFHDLHVHGSTNIVEAIQRSCNVFFYQLMLKTGFDFWSKYGRDFGFGSATGIDILEENPGLLPSEEYFDRKYGKGKWSQGLLLNLSIGQGELGVSPVQMANYAAIIANKGYFRNLHTVLKIKNKKDNEMTLAPVESRKLEISDRVWDIIREGMYECVNKDGGTGSAARVQGVSVCGKTGTAQTPPPRKDHAWFIGFAPKDNPKIAICVLIENVGFGGSFAAPIAGLCIERYLYGKIIRNIKLVSPSMEEDTEPEPSND
jgi:penicillin-binding protein 2